MVLSTLQVIRNKIRNLTARPSSDQISNDQLDFYVNTFYLYDFPEHLRLQTLRKNYTFFTKPNIERYPFPIDIYISAEPPIYANGFKLGYYQDQEIFYALWPKINFEERNIGTGDGVTPNPVLNNLSNTPIIPRTINLSAIINGNSVSNTDDGEGSFLSEGFTITDIIKAAPAIITSPGHAITTGDSVFIENVYGMTSINGGPYPVISVTQNTITINVDSTNFNDYISGGEILRENGNINYITGTISYDWGIPPDLSSNISTAYIPYVASRPREILFFNNEFILRPIPDAAYRIETVVYCKPTELLAHTQSPEIQQWWQCIALGASLKIFEDNGDHEEIVKYRPLFEEQLILVNRRTIKQQTSRRVSTPFANEFSSRNFGLWYDVYGS